MTQSRPADFYAGLRATTAPQEAPTAPPEPQGATTAPKGQQEPPQASSVAQEAQEAPTAPPEPPSPPVVDREAEKLIPACLRARVDLPPACEDYATRHCPSCVACQVVIRIKAAAGSKTRVLGAYCLVNHDWLTNTEGKSLIEFCSKHEEQGAPPFSLE